MHQATCSGCGSKCEVPFRPTGDKPVYCSDCFSENKGRGFEPKKSEQSDEKHDEMNKKLDKILKMLEIIHPKKTFTVEKSEVEEAEKEVKKEKKKAPAKKKAAAKKAPAKKAPVKKKAKK